jgi:small-conductance mechanosensitive channel
VPEPGSFEHLLTVDGWVVVAYQFGPPLIRAVLLAIGTWIAVRLARSSFNFASRRADAHARILIGRVIDIVIIGLGVATILDTVGVPLTTFVTILGVAGLGISLAMQDVLKSFVAGTFLLFERPFRIGDEISIKDQRGIVEHIGIRTTRLRNADNVQVIVPNGVVFAEIVANRTNEIKSPPAPVGAASADAADHESPPGSTPAAGIASATAEPPAVSSTAGVPAATPAPPAPVVARPSR